ncbi:MAG: hypothetical protein WB696_23015, partial [Chthoniobacterales bacterium]
RFPARPVIISSQNDRITASGKFLGIEACLFEALQEPIRTRFNWGLNWVSADTDGNRRNSIKSLSASSLDM